MTAWRLHLDTEASLELAHEAVASVRAGLVDLDADYDVLSLAAEVFWDTSNFRKAETLIAAWRRAVKRDKATNDELDELQVVTRDVRAVRLWARLKHRIPSAPDAWTLVNVAYRTLCDRAGGAKALSALVRADPWTGIGRLYGELLGIAVPVGRNLSEGVRGSRWTIFVQDAEAIARQIPTERVGHHEWHALVSQLLYTVLRRGDPDHDTELVKLLWRLDLVTRPRDERGMATFFNLCAEVSAYFGEHSKAAAYRRRARETLHRKGLHRHLKVINAKYFPPDSR